MNRERIVREVERLGPWFHNLDLGGVATAPSHSFGDYPRQKFARFQCIAQARFAADVTNVDVELHRMSVYEVKDLREKFDIVLFMGVLHHLRHPLLALDLIHDHVVDRTLVFQSVIRGSPHVAPLEEDHPVDERAVFERPSYPKLHFVEKRYGGDPTNWWIPNRACTEAMLRSAGFRIAANPEEEVYICELDTGDSKEGDAR
ncbi:MAG: Methyltransferase type 11 [Labilithrix sp.]|nr:Methyltransferase type 11 [Labilithrix sp.]